MDAQKTGALIAQARRERGLTQKDLSQAIHVSAQVVSKWERGLNFPDLSLLEPLGDCLGLTVSELLSGQRGEEPKEELLRDSLRLLMSQAGRKLRRWRRLAQACLGVLLVLALGSGFWFIKNHTELLPQPATVIVPRELSERDHLAARTAGNPDVYLFDVAAADGARHYQVQMELWTQRGWSGPGRQRRHTTPLRPGIRRWGSPIRRGGAVYHGAGGLHGPGDLADHAGGGSRPELGVFDECAGREVQGGPGARGGAGLLGPRGGGWGDPEARRRADHYLEHARLDGGGGEAPGSGGGALPPPAAEGLVSGCP